MKILTIILLLSLLGVITRAACEPDCECCDDTIDDPKCLDGEDGGKYRCLTKRNSYTWVGSVICLGVVLIILLVVSIQDKRFNQEAERVF